MALKQVDVNTLSFNPFTKISQQWMLITAGDESKFNTMTASWGGVGFLWRKPVATAYIRHSRYTLEFTEKEECFTLTFLKEGNKQALGLLGSKSGREIDKMKDSGLTPVFVQGQPTFEEAELVLVCKKLYADDIEAEHFIDKDIVTDCYSDNDYHKMYVAEIIACYQNEE